MPCSSSLKVVDGRGGSYTRGLDGADINFALNNLEGRSNPAATVALYSCPVEVSQPSSAVDA